MSQEYKNYEIYPDGTFGMKHIKNLGSGAVPVVLRGSYSNYLEAQKSIDKYLLEKKGKGNGKTSRAS